MFEVPAKPTSPPRGKAPESGGAEIDSTEPRSEMLALGAFPWRGEEASPSPWELLEKENSQWWELANAWSPRELEEFKHRHKIAWIDGLPHKLRDDIDGMFKGAHAGQPPVEMPTFERLAVRPPQSSVPRWVVQLLSRLALNKFLIEVHGSLEAGITHLQSIQPVKGRPEMWLPEQARIAYEQAVERFERERPGYTIATTPVAWTLRNAHTAKSPAGLQNDLSELQSALNGRVDPKSGPFPLAQYFGGFAVKAWENPNLTLPGGRDYHYLIEKFGGSDDTPGRARMSSTQPRDITRAAREPNSGANDSPPAVGDVREQFADMAATSKRFQNSMAAHLPKLKQARDQYFESMPLSGQGGDESVRQHATDVAAKELRVAFADWITGIDKDIAELQSSPGDHRAEIEALTWYRNQLLVPEFVFGKKTRSKKDEPEEAVADLLKTARYGETHRNRGDIVRDGAYGSYRFGNVPLIQLLEQGFVRDDPMPERSDNGLERLGVFNAEVVEALARAGFVPGALFGDTTRFVHSDAIDGVRK